MSEYVSDPLPENEVVEPAPGGRRTSLLNTSALLKKNRC